VKDDGEATGYFKLVADQNDASSQKRYDICLATAVVGKEGTAEVAKNTPADKTKRQTGIEGRHRTGQRMRRRSAESREQCPPFSR
jgi:hypothetical protein